MDIVAGDVRPLNVVCVQEVQHCVVIGYERHGVLFGNFAVAFLHAGAVVLGHRYADDARVAGVLPDLADKSLVGQLVDRVVLGFVVYREVDEYQVGVVAQHLGIAAVHAYVGAGRADSRVDVVHLCIGVLVFDPLGGESRIAVLVVGAGSLGYRTAEVRYGDFLACLELLYYLRYARGIALGVHQQREHVLSRLVCGLLVKSEFVLDRRGQQFGLHCNGKRGRVGSVRSVGICGVCGRNRAVGVICVICAVCVISGAVSRRSLLAVGIS